MRNVFIKTICLAVLMLSTIPVSAMKTRFIKSLMAMVLTLGALPMMGQDYMNVYFKNGAFRKFYMKNITEITTSKFDSEGIQHSEYEFQHVTTNYAKYIYSLEDVDSITFTKIDEELAEHNFVSAMPKVFNAISDCKSIDDVENKIDQIKNAGTITMVDRNLVCI